MKHNGTVPELSVQITCSFKSIQPIFPRFQYNTTFLKKNTLHHIFLSTSPSKSVLLDVASQEKRGTQRGIL
jgi:hypothetical protein